MANLTEEQKTAVARVVNHLEGIYSQVTHLIHVYDTAQWKGVIISDIPGYDIAGLFPESLEEWHASLEAKIEELTQLMAPDYICSGAEIGKKDCGTCHHASPHKLINACSHPEACPCANDQTVVCNRLVGEEG